MDGQASIFWTALFLQTILHQGKFFGQLAVDSLRHAQVAFLRSQFQIQAHLREGPRAHIAAAAFQGVRRA